MLCLYGKKTTHIQHCVSNVVDKDLLCLGLDMFGKRTNMCVSHLLLVLKTPSMDDYCKPFG